MSDCCQCSRPGTSKCRCVHPGPIFCDECYQTHINQGHAFSNSAVLRAVPSQEGGTDEKNLDYTRMLLIASLEDARKVREEAASTFNGLIQCVYETKVRVDAQLSEAIEALSSYVECYTTNTYGHLVLDRLRRTLKPEDLSKRLNLLSWSKSTEDIETLLKYAFVFSANSFLFGEDTPHTEVQQQFVPIFASLWDAFEVEDGTKVNIACLAAKTLKECSVWVNLGETQVLMCGEPRTKNAYLFDLATQQFKPVSPQLFIQNRPGLGRTGGNVYSFGGQWRDVHQRYCERYEEATGQWAAIPVMQFPRYYFTPALEGSVFYLIGGWDCSACETFDTLSQSFQTLKFEMGHTGACLSLIYDGDVIILMNRHLSVWEKKTGSENPSTYGKWGDFTLYLTVPPYRRGEKVYMVGFDKDASVLYELDLSTKQIAEKTPQVSFNYE